VMHVRPFLLQLDETLEHSRLFFLSNSRRCRSPEMSGCRVAVSPGTQRRPRRLPVP
jgi:hypothetical protein